MGALRISKDACRAFALTHSWENSARQFIGHLSQVVIGGFSQAGRRIGDRGACTRVSGVPVSAPKGHTMAIAAELDKDTIVRAYARWAPVYDLVFGPVFEHGRRAAIDAAERIGGRILEVGVGTGMSLPDYDADVRLFGVDISEPMLRKAQERVTAPRPGKCRGARRHGCRAI